MENDFVGEVTVKPLDCTVCIRLQLQLKCYSGLMNLFGTTPNLRVSTILERTTHYMFMFTVNIQELAYGR